MKDLIKQLASEQPGLKKARKTGPYKQPLTSWGCLDYDALTDEIKACFRAGRKVRDNKAKITAALNLMHELRGSDYRHGYSNDPGMYHKYYRELHKEFAEKLNP